MLLDRLRLGLEDEVSMRNDAVAVTHDFCAL